MLFVISILLCILLYIDIVCLIDGKFNLFVKICKYIILWNKIEM